MSSHDAWQRLAMEMYDGNRFIIMAPVYDDSLDIADFTSIKLMQCANRIIHLKTGKVIKDRWCDLVDNFNTWWLAMTTWPRYY